MSEQTPEAASPPQRAWRFYIDDMIGFAGNVLTYTDGQDQAGFEKSRLHYDATVRNLELIGEAASHVPPHVREFAPKIPWRLIVATRNRLIHGYLGIDNDTLWSIVRDDTPSLLTELQALKKAADSGQLT
jgi:uncharacterized protein with HEPN domain